jgi:predicted transcriptional regulator
MTDSELMTRYNLSAKGLQSLFSKLVKAGAIDKLELDQRMLSLRDTVKISQEVKTITEDAEEIGDAGQATIRVQDAVADIRSGMTDTELMEKYDLSSKGLQSFFHELTVAGAVSRQDLERRVSMSEESVDLVDIIQKLGLDRTTRPLADAGQVPKHCIACGAPQTAEYEECPVCGVSPQEYKARKAWEERMAQAAWTCPACGRPQQKVYDECPVCGVIVAKYKKE